MTILIGVLIVVSIWSLFGIVYLSLQVKEHDYFEFSLTREQKIWIMERDGNSCQFSQWDIPSKTYLICGNASIDTFLIGKVPIKLSNHVCLCEKHAEWLSNSGKKVTMEQLLITSARERGKVLAAKKDYPFE